jgi:hypothetical protein
VGELLTFRVGDAPTLKRCRKLNCTVPVGPTQPPDRFGVRSSTDCPAAPRERTPIVTKPTAIERK